MSWIQKSFTLPPKSRGSYLITDEVVKNVPEIKQFKVGLLNLFVQHTSCGLSLNENYDSDVRYVYLSPLPFPKTTILFCSPSFNSRVRNRVWPAPHATLKTNPLLAKT